MANTRDIRTRQTLDNSQFKKGLKDSQTSLGGFKNLITSIGPAIGVAFGGREILRFIGSTIELASAAEGVKTAFDRLNDVTLLNRLKNSTHGVVSELELMKAAVNWNNFKIPMEKLPVALSFAMQRAKDTGQSVDYLVNSIVMGLGRKSPKILDNLGISILSINEEVAKTGDFFTGVFNLIERETVKSGGYLETFSDKIGNVNTAWTDLKMTIGEVLMNAGSDTNGIPAVALAMRGLTEVIKNADFSKFGTIFKVVTGVMIPLKGIVTLLKAVNGELRIMAEQSARDNRFSEEMAADKQQIDDMAKSLTSNGIPAEQAYKDAKKLMILELIRQREMVYDITDAYDEYTKRIDALRDKEGTDSISTTYDEISTKLKELNSQLLESITLNDGNAQAIANQVVSLERQKKAIDETAKALTLYGDEAMIARRKIDAAFAKKVEMQSFTFEDIKNAGAISDDAQKIGDAMVKLGQDYMTGMQLMQEAGPKIDMELRNTYDGFKAFSDKFEPLSIEIGDMVQQAMTELSYIISEGLSMMITSLIQGSGDLSSVMNNIMGMFGDFLKSLGQALIAYGVAKMMTKIMESMGAAAAIAAGFALVIAGSALSAAFAKPVPMATGGTVPSGFANDTYPAMLSSGETVIPAPIPLVGSMNSNSQRVEVVGMIRGEDIYFINAKYSKKLNTYR